jgi:hypothetical protein
MLLFCGEEFADFKITVFLFFSGETAGRRAWQVHHGRHDRKQSCRWYVCPFLFSWWSLLNAYLSPGNQSIPASGPASLTYGQSVTDGQSLLYAHSYLQSESLTTIYLFLACVDWETTVKMLDTLRKGVQERRRKNGTTPTTSSTATPVTNGHSATKEFNDLSTLHVARGA